MQCKEWDDANSELFKESHDEAVHKISYESKLYELISASLEKGFTGNSFFQKIKFHPFRNHSLERCSKSYMLSSMGL